jgi:8-oxo-dGTP pyrophosphatase MutT (NUDIX family)
MLQRSPSEKLYPGTWQIVTGIIEAGETAVSAALRELDEETSLHLLHFWAVPMLDSFFDVRNNSVQLCPLFAGEVDPGAEPTLSPEHQKYEWMEIEDALKCLVWPGHHKAVETVHQYIVAGRQAARLTEIHLTNAERKSP